MKHLSTHRRGYWGNLIEDDSGKAYSCRVSAYMPKLMLHICAPNFSKSIHLRSTLLQASATNRACFVDCRLLVVVPETLTPGVLSVVWKQCHWMLVMADGDNRGYDWRDLCRQLSYRLWVSVAVWWNVVISIMSSEEDPTSAHVQPLLSKSLEWAQVGETIQWPILSVIQM